jgi:hypothetical protein
MPNPAGTSLPNPHSYTVMNFSGSWVIRDNVTGLTWQRDLMANTLTWDAANAYCDGLSFAFQDDWRLPSRIELVSLVDFTRDDPAIDPIFTNTNPASFWTASTTPADRSRGYVVDFDEGVTLDEVLTKAYRVRCVRGGS